MEVKPFLKWVGGKRQLLPELTRRLPTEVEREGRVGRYVEPFVGGGAVLFHLLSEYIVENVVIADINQNLIDTYRALKLSKTAVGKKLHRLQTDYLAADDEGREELYYDARECFNDNEMDIPTTAAYMIFLNRTGFNGLYRENQSGEFNVPHGSYVAPTIYDRENLERVHAALQGVEILCGDYTCCERYIDSTSLVYLDPPYMPTEHGSFTAYTKNRFDLGEQHRLKQFVDRIDGRGARFLLSNSRHPELEELYRHYNIDIVQARRSVNSDGGGRGVVEEIVVCNY